MPKKPWEQMVIGADKSLTPNQFPFNPKTPELMKVRGREVILEIEKLRVISMSTECVL